MSITTKLEHVKGVVLVRIESAKEPIILPKNIYLAMKKSGRKIELLKEAQHSYQLT